MVDRKDGGEGSGSGVTITITTTTHTRSSRVVMSGGGGGGGGNNHRRSYAFCHSFSSVKGLVWDVVRCIRSQKAIVPPCQILKEGIERSIGFNISPV